MSNSSVVILASSKEEWILRLNDYRTEAGDFLARIGAKAEPTSTMLEMLEEELQLLRNSMDNPDEFRHQLYDILFILFSIAAKHAMDLDMEWEKGRQKKNEKYASG